MLEQETTGHDTRGDHMWLVTTYTMNTFDDNIKTEREETWHEYNIILLLKVKTDNEILCLNVD